MTTCLALLRIHWTHWRIQSSDSPKQRRFVKLIPLLLLTGLPAFSQSLAVGLDSLRHLETIHPGIRKLSATYAVKDTTHLGLDVYSLGDSVRKKPCVLFVFGGAFVAGRRDDELYNRYVNTLVEHGYVVVPLTYRLGLKGVKPPTKFDLAPLEKAIGMAVEDVYDATNRVEGLGHEVSVLPMIDRLPVILQFLEQHVIQRKSYQIDLSFKDPTAKPLMMLNTKELFRKLEKPSTRR